MNKALLVFLIIITGFSPSFSQTANTTPVPATEILQLKESTYNFGKIPQGRPVTHEFEVMNTGKDPIVIDEVQASCGCTTPEWSRDPIAPGGVAKIKVGYNAAAEGAFSKTVTVVYNTNLNKTIVISGEVYKSPSTSAPLNPSLSLLKQINQ